MAETPKLEMESVGDTYGLEEKIDTQKISVLDHVNGFHYSTAEKSDSFVIDMTTFSPNPNVINKDFSANSRITLQRNFSRKGAQRNNEKKNLDRETPISNSSPKGSVMPEKVAAKAIGTADQCSNVPQGHHQITISTAAALESRNGFKKSSFKRSSGSWLLDPKKVVIFFATMSSVGTLLLIFFTLSLYNANSDEAALA